MPIYSYKCESCGFKKDVLQKMSDQPLSVCPSCGVDAFAKQVTAAGFRLKGTGWYVTDFRDSGKRPGSEAGDSGSSEPAPADAAPAPAAAAPAARPPAAPAADSAAK
ncbi:MAG: FmdB family zinc ribbon protein [Ottowia sp.]|nr:zinc ribbon domain-containing protein [Ottowia sp.]